MMRAYISCEGSVPDIRLRNLMFEVSLVSKVSVLDVLDKPVHGEVNLIVGYRDSDL